MAEINKQVGVDTSQGKGRQKKYHRRSPWACDECRLRKRKCDGTQPCNACRGIDRDCTYDYKSRPLPAPNQRLRVVEERLRNVRSLVYQLKIRSQPDQTNSLDAIIEACDRPLPDVVEKSTPTGDNDTGNERSFRKLSSMMGNSGQFISDGPWRAAFYGPLSGFCFIWTTLQLFTIDPVKSAAPKTIHTIIVDIFNGGLSSIEMPGMTPGAFQILPPKDLTFELLDVFFTRCHPLVCFLHENDFKQTVEQTYNEPRLQFVGSEYQFMPLLHAVLALGYLFHSPRHRSYGCHATVKDAHFSTARNSLDLTRCNDLISLQTLLCLIQFLISTSRLASAHTLIGIACSAMYRLGLHSKTDRSLNISDGQRQTRARLFVTILRMDSYASLILGLPAFVDLQALDHRMLDPGSRKSSSSFRTSLAQTNDDLQQAASSRHLELMKLISAGFKDVFLTSVDGAPPEEEHNHTSVNADRLAEVEIEFQEWARDTTPLVGKLAENESLAVCRYELEMAYYFGQVLICQPFLHYVIKMAAGSPISKKQSQYALACIKIASTTITRSELMSQRDALYPASWLSIYTIFLAVGSLMFLVAAHKGTSKPGEAWRKAEVGIRILVSMSCVDDGATRCLRTLKMITQQLSHTVDFDWDHIEATTVRMCHSNANNDARHWSKSNVSSPYTTVGTPNTPKDFQRNAIPKTPSLPVPWSGKPLSLEEMTNNLAEQEFTPLDADQIFAQAQKSSVAGGFDMFGSLDQYRH